ncbi:MAG: glycosyltransferase family A protein [Nanoarchaeota archaeon]|nr:glycosyltransferase family A protein [Nanoarchaeota archaeon]
MQPKVLVGCPTSDHKAYCLEPYIEGLKKLTYNNKDILIVDNSATDDYMKRIQTLGIPAVHIPWHPSARERIIQSRNILREKTINEGYEYFLSLEQDVIPPPNIIETLLSHHKEIIAGIYYNKFPTPQGEIELLPLAYKVKEDYLRPLTPQELEGKQPISVAGIGLGCVLIHRNILKKIKFTYTPDTAAFDDMHFSKEVLQQGHKIFVDPTQKCMHLIKNWTWEGIER